MGVKLYEIELHQVKNYNLDFVFMLIYRDTSTYQSANERIVVVLLGFQFKI